MARARTTIRLAADCIVRMEILDLGGGAALNVFEVPTAEIIGDRRRQGGRGAIDHDALAVDSRATLETVKDRARRARSCGAHSVLVSS
jgi:hypothetical protein